MKTIVACPHCGKDVAWSKDSSWKPFCSERCRLIDLGAWADEQYKIPTKEGPGMDTLDKDVPQQDWD